MSADDEFDGLARMYRREQKALVELKDAVRNALQWVGKDDDLARDLLLTALGDREQ